MEKYKLTYKAGPLTAYGNGYSIFSALADLEDAMSEEHVDLGVIEDINFNALIESIRGGLPFIHEDFTITTEFIEDQ